VALRLNEDARIEAFDVAEDLLRVYRVARAGLNAVLGCDGFGVSFAWSWVPYGKGVGEPSPEPGQPLIHVFGRYPGERVSPVRVMARPVSQRRAPLPPTEQRELDQRLTEALATAAPAPPVEPDVDPAACDGCKSEVERDQELWRADRARVIRPRNPWSRRTSS
jgi:hypothetical protein